MLPLAYSPWQEGEAPDPTSPLLPAAEPVLGGPDEGVNTFVERRRIAHRLSELGAEHLQVRVV